MKKTSMHTVNEMLYGLHICLQFMKEKRTNEKVNGNINKERVRECILKSYIVTRSILLEFKINVY